MVHLGGGRSWARKRGGSELERRRPWWTTARERRRAREGVKRGKERACWCPSSSAAGRVAEGGTRDSGGGAWRPRSQHASPFGHFPEHVAGVGEGDVGSQFGPLPGRISPWAKNEVYSPQPTLRFSFKVPEHLSSVTTGN
jgi:hypothetical protein